MFVPMNRGGDVLFAEAGGAVVETLQPTTSDSLTIRWKMSGVEDMFGQQTQKLEGTALTTFKGVLKLVPQDQEIAYTIEPTESCWKTLCIPLPLEKLEPGSYTLEIQYGSGKETRRQTRQLRVIWPSRPFSLMDIDLALDALRHIAKETEIDDLLSGSAAHRAEAFHRFWTERDRDTTTACNEAMAEYYYRVDEAMRKFSTARENDGYKTDRGRIYILYGPPPKSDRLLKPDAPPSEVWTYQHLHKRFIFIDPERNGNYILSQAESL
jgi:GWxTD domain-containing protein